MLDIVVEVNPWWAEGQLWVNGTLEGQDDVLEKIAGVMLYMFKWRGFNEARWCTVGPSCRGVLASLAVGLERVVHLTRSDPACTDYHLHGAERMQASGVRKYMAIAGLVSFVADAVLTEVMEDDRLAGRYDRLLDAQTEEISWLEGLPEFVWDRFAVLAGGGIRGLNLRTEVLQAAHTAGGFMHARIFEPLRAWPWRLVSGGGDLRQSLEALEQTAEPVGEAFTDKVRCLLKLGYSPVKVAEAVNLLKDVSWSTIGVEQAHGSCGIMHKFHPLYTGGQLAQRSFLHQCRHILVPHADQRTQSRLERSLQGVRDRRPQKTTGRNVLVSHVFAGLRRSIPAGSSMPRALRDTALRQAHQFWRDLGPAEMAALAAEAHVGGAKRIEAARNDAEHAQAALDLHLCRVRQERAGGLTSQSAELRFEEGDFAAMARLLSTFSFCKGEVCKLRTRHMTPPLAPPAEVRAAFENLPLQLSPASPPRAIPGWLRGVCQLRAFFLGAVFKMPEDRGGQAYLLLPPP